MSHRLLESMQEPEVLHWNCITPHDGLTTEGNNQDVTIMTTTMTTLLLSETPLPRQQAASLETIFKVSLA
jgi:hypothetical protein